MSKEAGTDREFLEGMVEMNSELVDAGWFKRLLSLAR